MGETLEGQQAATRHRINVDAYYKMAEAGILAPDDRVELIEGEIIDMVPICSSHGGTTNRLNRLFARAAADGLVLVSVQGPLRLDDKNEPQPDVLLLKPRSDDYHGAHPSAADVLLLVEVSESTLSYDRGAKLSLYARHGVPEVWIVDLRGAAIEVCREPTGGAYARIERLTSGSLAPALVPGIAIDVRVDGAPAPGASRKARPPEDVTREARRATALSHCLSTSSWVCPADLRAVFGHDQRMVAALDHRERRARGHAPADVGEEVERTERIARSLNEEDRDF
jgi:Uma2 family endonuclease